MDGSSRKPPSAVGFWTTMVVIVMLIAVAVGVGLPLVSQLLGPVWDGLFNRG